MELLIFEKIILSLAIGALIGVEREWHAKKSNDIMAGMRTFMLVSVLGLMTSYISSMFSSNIFIYIGLAAVASAMVAGYCINFKKTGSMGLTSELAFLLTYVIGVILFFEESPFFLSISLGVILTIVLFFREPMHRFVKQRTKKEVRDAVIFAALVFIVLPILPNYPLDPYGAFNPYLVWLSMVLVMTVSMVGYVAVKTLGKHGLSVTGFFGGLANSTSVTVSMSALAKKSRQAAKSASFVVIVASSTMFLRMVFVSMFFDADVALLLAPVFGVICAIGYIISLFAWRRIGKKTTGIQMSSPISFKSVLKFMVIFVIVLFASNLAKTYFPSAIYPIAALSGIFNVDAITIGLASMAGGISADVAVTGIIIAAVSNTISKMAMARIIGGKEMGKSVGKLFIPLIISSVVVAAMLFFLV